MNSPKYRVFVCTKQRAATSEEGCCFDVGGMDVYQAFQDEVVRLELTDNVEIRKSGCLDCCESGAVAMVCQSNNRDLSWLPTKIRVKLRKLLFPNRHLYGNLNYDKVSAIVESHLIKGKPVKNCQISTTNKRS